MLISLLQEIRRQPLWARELMFVFCVIITVSAAGAVWFDSFQHSIIALGNPGVDIDKKFFVQTESRFSPLALIGKGVGFLRANVYSFLNIYDEDSASKNDKINGNAVYLLPLAEDRTE